MALGRCCSMALFLLCGAGVLAATDQSQQESENQQRKLARLERQVASLRDSYALARRDAQEAKQQLRDIRKRLEALGGTALGESEARLIETAAQLEATNAQLVRITQSAQQLSAAIEAYTQKVQMDDAESVLQLEAAQRDLELALGYRTEPLDEQAGTLNQAQVLSIDSSSGAIVINAGRKAKVEVGMPMEIIRGDEVLAEAIVTDVRDGVSALLVHKHLKPGIAIKVGDYVSIKTSD